MLVLTRKTNEEFIVTIPPSDQQRTMIVKLVATGRGKARIGFMASDDIKIIRAELEEQPVELEGGEL